jgi:small subunit ribosomal protein S1
MFSKSLKKVKDESVSPPKVGEIVEGKIITFEPHSLFLDLGPRGIGIISGRNFYESKDVLKSLEPGDTLMAKVIDLENEDGYRELSPKEASEEITWETLKEKKEKGENLEVKITGANKGGLLAEVKGIPAFLPTSQLSPQNYPRVEGGDSTKIVKELQNLIGEKLKVKIFSLDPREEKIILSEKAGQKEEIKEILKNYQVGDVVEGRITGVTNFGIFLKFGKDELEGLVHVSEIEKDEKKELPDILKIGQKIKAKIIEIKEERVYLSLKNIT